MTDKEQATRLADALMTSAVSVRAPRRVEVDSDALLQAAEKLRRWPDGEPVAWRYQDARGSFRYRGYVAGFDKDYAILRPIPLYTAPPAERIAALEGALEAARVALEEMEYARTDKAERLAAEALRKIEEVQR